MKFTPQDHVWKRFWNLKFFRPKQAFSHFFWPILHKTSKNSTTAIYEGIWKIPKLCVRLGENLTKTINTPLWEMSSKAFFGWWKLLQNRVYLRALKTTLMMPGVKVFSIFPSIKVKICPSLSQSGLCVYETSVVEANICPFSDFTLYLAQYFSMSVTNYLRNLGLSLLNNY